MSTETPDGLDFEVTHGPAVDPPSVDPTPPAEPDADPYADPDTEDDARAEEGKTTRLRKRAQQAEQDRDALREQLDTARRQLVEFTMRQVVTHPGAFWALSGTSASDYFRDDGTLDTDKITADATRVRTEYGLTGTPRPDASQGAAHDTGSGGGWGSVLRGRTG